MRGATVKASSLGGVGSLGSGTRLTTWENEDNDLCRSLIGAAISPMRRILSAGLRGPSDVNL
jgi:hypothetical protein